MKPMHGPTFQDSQTEPVAPDMTTDHEAMRERSSPSKDSNQMKHDPVGTSARLHREADSLGDSMALGYTNDD